MNQRQIIYFVAILALSMTLVIAVFFAIYRFEPEILGLPPIVIDSAKTIPDKKVTLSSRKLMELEQIAFEKKILKEKYDSLFASKRKLTDSLAKLHQQFQISSKQPSTSADRKLSDSLNKIRELYDKVLRDLKSAQIRLTSQEQQAKSGSDSLEAIHYKAFAKIYNNTRPYEVAKILEKIDAKDAASILKSMDKKKAGKVIEVMMPDVAAAILLLN